MQIHKVVTPEFVKKFACVGPSCLISCCQGWQIHIDKKTHHTYLNEQHPKIALLAKENLLRVRNGKSRYSIIKLDAQGQCPFLDENKFCLVHRDLGEKALSETCSTYPRSKKYYADTTRHSMVLSCPEVARLVLFDADSMLVHEQDDLLAKAKNTFTARQPVNQIHQIVHLFAWHLLQAPSLNVEENLMALAQFMVYLQRIEFDLHNHFAQAEQYHQELLSELAAGISLMSQSTPTESVGLKVRALTVLGSLVANKSSRDRIIADAHRKMAVYLDVANSPDKQALADKFAVLNKQWQQLCQDSILSAPHVLRNLLTYKIYHCHFPDADFSTVMRQVYRLILDYFYIKHLLSLTSLEATLDEATVLKIVASLAESTLHSSTINQRMNEAIDMINAGDDLSCLLLIS
ncbi:lysine-N-methylase [Escherichia sp. E4208]|uniref:flagellin lysine-N-methylase n=1 Tax=unclassified Escherichia TaxID=2608889 RepID=UPI00102A5EB2|nr:MULTISPECIES: flagellin lysine-N-methylase [unclassified Escherichia]RZM97816.1 lysine-N-methylase [Escherichia sp. E14V5]RZN01248.1 lysine-N-methylase [Escherichia sp. E14V7]RZN26188.1 lysine-N-methylase [Escherichia sp. E14V10]TGB56584.1 lysine-N-methylase [Escherichia sp. E5028]TGB84983.1 lysine-N-methylase [Escherichia sp. E4208]